MIKSISSYISTRTKGIYAKNTLVLLAGSSAAHLISAFMLPILSRLYNPEQFGVFGIFLSVIGITAVFSSGKFELAIVTEPKFKRRIALATLAITTSMIYLSFLLVMYSILKTMGVFSFKGITLDILILFCVGLLATVIHDSVMNFKISQETVQPIARAKVIRISTTSIAQVFFYFLGVLKIGLIIGEVAGRISAILSVLKYKFSYLKISKRRLLRTLNYIKLVALKNLEYPFKIAPSWTINNASTLLLPAFIGWQFGLAISGGFFLMYKIFSLPETAIVQSVNQSFMVELKRHKRSQKKQLEIFQKTAKTLFILSLFIYPLLGLIFYFGVGTIFGQEWERYSLFGVLMIPYFIAQFTMSSLYVSLNILGYHSSQLKWDIFRSGTLFLICLTIHFLDLNILNFILSLSVFTFIVYGLLFLLIHSKMSKGAN